MRRMRPGTGAETTKTSRTRVSPSSLTRDLQRAARDVCEVDRHRARPEQPGERKGEQQRERQPEQQAAARRRIKRSLPRLQHGDEVEAIERRRTSSADMMAGDRAPTSMAQP